MVMMDFLSSATRFHSHSDTPSDPRPVSTVSVAHRPRYRRLGRTAETIMRTMAPPIRISCGRMLWYSTGM